MEGLRFNSAIARITELNNELTRTAEPVPREVATNLVLMLGPLVPHIAEELWERLGNEGSVVHERFPEADEIKAAIVGPEPLSQAADAPLSRAICNARADSGADARRVG